MYPRYTVRRASGYLQITDETGKTTGEGDTLQCVHCQGAWIVAPGSGVRRGWCLRCNGPTCGGAGCQACTPWERRLEMAEQRHRLWRAMEGR